MKDEVKKKFLALIIDDEVQIRRLLRVTLEANGYTVIESVNGQDGLVEAASRRPDIVILDLGLPDLDGVAVLKRLREWSRIPILVLSVRERDQDKIAALDNGADDYVTKPFSTPELLARLRVAMRHASPAEEQKVFRNGELEIDFVNRSVTRNGKAVKLTVTEYSLLRLLACNVGKVLTHRYILKEVWGPNAVDQTHYLRVYVARLREKIESEQSRPAMLMTEAGIGYRFMSESQG